MSGKTYSLLHCHSHNSLLDGLAKEEQLVQRAKELNLHSIALTDHGNMYGVVPFYQAGQEHEVRTITGCEFYITDNIKKKPETRESLAHLILLVQNEKGWQNILKLLEIANHPDHFYYKPRMDRAILREHSQGLIGLSACLAGELPRSLFMDHDAAFADMIDGKPATEEYVEMFLQLDFTKFKDIAMEYKEIFDGQFYLELQDAGLAAQKVINRKFRELGPEIGIGCVPTSDCHFTKPDEAKLHQVLLCVQTKKTWDEMDAHEVLEFTVDPMLSYNEMAKKFTEEELARTVEIAERCDFDLPIGTLHAPKFKTPKGMSDMGYLRKLCEEGWERKKRLGNYPNAEEYEVRLEQELNIIEASRLASYMLIVWDCVKYCVDNEIPFGIRGSANGCIILWAIGVTDHVLDPIKFGLYFERFYNIGRNSPPSISFDEYSYEEFEKNRLKVDLKSMNLPDLGFVEPNDQLTQTHIDWLEKEREIIKENPNISEYLLHLKQADVKIKNNSCNSMIAYMLEITNQVPEKPIKITPGRIKLPDVDIDIASSKRGEVVEFIRNKYGQMNTAQISTFGTLKARMVIKDLFRVFNVGGGKTTAKEEAELITKMIPMDPDITIADALKLVPELKKMREDHEEIWDMAEKLEGVKRQRSTHAAGLVIADRPLSHLIPLTYDPKLGLVTGLDMEDVESFGLIKFDFLGVNAYDVVKTCIDLINEGDLFKEISVEKKSVLSRKDSKPKITRQEKVDTEGISMSMVFGESCKDCPLKKEEYPPVVGKGTGHNKIMLVGEAPGENEQREGIPFCGRSGQLLDKLLDKAGIKKDDCFITNVVKCRPPNNRDPENGELERCKGYLWDQIKKLEPKVLVTIGRISSQILMGEDTPITRMEPKLLDWPNMPIHAIPIFHPSYILRRGMNDALVSKCVARLQLAKRKSEAKNMDFEDE